MNRSITRLAAALVLAVMAAVNVNCIYAQSVAFQLDAPIDLGSNLTRMGSLQWSHVLGTDWDQDFQFGGFIGAQDTTVLPAIPPFLNDPVVADTRTGLRMAGNVSGSTGLEFYADFRASGLESGAAFDFRPRIIDLPPQVSQGEFVKLRTAPGVVNNAAFTESLVDLPSFDAGMNFFFNLNLNSTIDYGLFPFVPYGSASFSTPPININQNLLKFAFDFDPDSNDGEGLPPTFVMFENTLFEQRLGLLDDDQFLAEKQFSVEMNVKDDPVKRRLDLGSAHLVNPFGTGDSILGPGQRNLTVKTAMNESSVQYSFESALVRLGLDLDGIAAYLGSAALTGVGHSFTRIEKKFNDGKISLTGDIIDIKYGPEFGYRESMKIEPDFAVTLQFKHGDTPATVAIDDNGQISLADSFTGKWSDLPDIALLDDQPVEVNVSFDRLTGKQSKRGVFYLSDYIELTLLELEELSLRDGPKITLPPLYQTRGSVLGALLKQVEIPLFDQTQAITPFGFSANVAGASSFTLTPTPSTIVYAARVGDEFSTSVNAWRELATHAAPASLQDSVLVIASGGGSAQVISDLDPERMTDDGDPFGTSIEVNVAGLVIPERATFTQYNARKWSLPRIVNDGFYHGNGYTGINGLVLTIGGNGEMRFDGTLEIDAVALLHGPDHTITLRDPSSIDGQQHRLTAQQFGNAGRIAIQGPLVTNLTATQRFENSGSIAVTGGETVLTTPLLLNDGRIEARGPTTSLRIDQAAAFGQINIQSTSGTGRFIADNGATLQFAKTVLLDTQGVDPNPVRFEATAGGTVRFDGPIRAFDAGVAELHVDETSTMILSGIEVMRRDAQVSLVNKGLVEVNNGSNRLYFTPITASGQNPPAPEAEIVGINIVNEGTIRVQPSAGVAFALFGFEAEIKNYVPGGATLGPGTWEVIGQVPVNPYKNDRGATFVAGQRKAILEILISRISNDDTYLGRIDFGDTDGDGINDGHSAEDYDTSLAISEANVLLNGAARFDYFNTIRENRGTFTLRNKNHFDTVGGLVNSGEIRVESESRLNVFGDLIVNEGTVFVDTTSVLDVRGNAIEVIGGNLTVQRGAVPLAVNTPWIVREKWIGVDDEGNDIVREARVSYGGAWFPTIGPNADILVEGRQAVFEPLSGLNIIEGKLTLAGGAELHRTTQQLLIQNSGTLRLATGGKLSVTGTLTNRGRLEIGADSFLTVSGPFNSTSGSVRLDGLIHAANLNAGAGTIVSGLGRFTGSLNVNGPFLAKIVAADAPGDPSGLFVDGQATLGGPLHLALAGYVPDDSDTITVLEAAGGLSGSPTNIANGQRLEVNGGVGSFLVHHGPASLFEPNRVVLSAFEPALTADINLDGRVDRTDVAVFAAHFGRVGDATWSTGDFDGDRATTLADWSMLQSHLGESVFPPAVAGAVPEPSTGLTCFAFVAFAVVVLRRPLRRSNVRTTAGR
jgi:hypothetical protein